MYFPLGICRFSFRIEEVLHIKDGDISFHSGYVTINLEVIKIDQLKKGNQVVIAESSNNDASPVKIFKRYCLILKVVPLIAVFMFSGLFLRPDQVIA